MLTITGICEILMGAALALRIIGCASNNISTTPLFEVTVEFELPFYLLFPF